MMLMATPFRHYAIDIIFNIFFTILMLPLRADATLSIRRRRHDATPFSIIHFSPLPPLLRHATVYDAITPFWLPRHWYATPLMPPLFHDADIIDITSDASWLRHYATPPLLFSLFRRLACCHYCLIAVISAIISQHLIFHWLPPSSLNITHYAIAVTLFHEPPLFITITISSLSLPISLSPSLVTSLGYTITIIIIIIIINDNNITAHHHSIITITITIIIIEHHQSNNNNK